MFFAPSPQSVNVTASPTAAAGPPSPPTSPKFGCRLFAYMSPGNPPQQDAFLKQCLLDGSNSLFWQSLTDLHDPTLCQFQARDPKTVAWLVKDSNLDHPPEARLQNISWGIASPKSRWNRQLQVFKETSPLRNSETFEAHCLKAAKAKPKTLLAHLRYASQSRPSLADAHPFPHEDWLLMHNGAVTESTLHKLGNGLMRAEQNFPSLIPIPQGLTDSELVQSYLAAQLLAETGQSRIGPLKTAQLKNIFADTMGTLMNAHQQDVEENRLDKTQANHYGLNFIISDGRRTLASRHAEPLYLGTWQHKNRPKTYLLASRPIQPNENANLPDIHWKLVPEQCMVVLKHVRKWWRKPQVQASIEPIALPSRYPWLPGINQRRLSFSNLPPASPPPLSEWA